jgi:hypothetical protein
MEPRYGLLAGGVPLPPRRPPGIGGSGADLPASPRFPPGGRPPSPAEEMLRQDKEREEKAEAQRQAQGMTQLEELKRDYPYGAGFPETSPSFPRPAGQKAISEINNYFNVKELFATPSEETPADSYFGEGQMPPEYEPARPIPLGEIQRRWGVPRLEDL